MYTYRPRADSSERAASTVAITGHVLLEAYLLARDAKWLDAARRAGDTVIAAPDMNGNGTYGWGRFWPKSVSRENPEGSNTTFSIGCTLRRNAPYDDEFYDNGRIGHFLLDLHLATGDKRYLDAARRMIEDSWDFGAATPEGGFYYYKTIGDCDRNWHVKNINMLMAVPIALLYKITAERKYQVRLAAMMQAERQEIRRVVNGRPSPNLGYYAVQTMIEKPTQGTYVSRAQTTDLAGPIRCNLKTGSGESCTTHLGLEARSIDLVGRILPTEAPGFSEDIKIIMSGALDRDAELCGSEKTPLGNARNWVHCAAHYCALRRLDSKYRQLCEERAEKATLVPDLLLGIFWGRPDRYPQKAGAASAP